MPTDDKITPHNPFSLSGRLGQKLFWPWAGAIVGFRLVASIIVSIRPDWTFLRRTDFLLIFLAILVGRRMKDFSVHPAWGWLAIALISFVVPVGSIFLWPPHAPAGPLDIVPNWVGLLTFVALLALIVSVGLKKGDPGTNRFGEPQGPSPLPPPEASPS
jgi:uncharacterized membrane protein YhaH (DUF805 family)